jgi:hypothetical protein
MVFFATLMLGTLGTARADCPADAAQVRADVDAAYEAYLAFDIPGFTAGEQVVRADLACVTEALSPDTAARIHRNEALAAVLDKDSARMVSALRGMRAADPDFVLSADVAPSGSDIRTLFDASAAFGTGTATPVTQPGVAVTVDGHPKQTSIPNERAALVQVRFMRSGLQTWYVDAGGLPADLLRAIIEPAEDLEAAEPLAQAGRSRVAIREPRDVPTAEYRGHSSRSLLITGLATGLASGASLIAAASEKERFFSASPEDAQAVYNANQALGFTGYGLGVAAVGLGLTAVIVGRW